MGNQLTAEGIIQHIDQYAPDLTVYELLPGTVSQTSQPTRVWQHKFTSQRLIQNQYITQTWLQLIDILQSFSFRYNNPLVIASKYLTIDNSQSIKKLLDNNNDRIHFPTTVVSVFYEASIINLSHFKEIPQQDGAYVLVQSLKGFQALVKRLKFSFQVKEQMFHITASRKFKVWLGGDITDIRTTNVLTPLLFESNMILQILDITKANIFFTNTQLSHNNNTQVQNHRRRSSMMLGAVIQMLIKDNPQSFQKAIELTQMYLCKYEISVGTFMSCLKDFTIQQLLGLMEKNKEHMVQKRYAVSTDQNSTIPINNNSSLVSMIRPFTPQSNVFSTQSLGTQMQRNNSMGNLTHYQSQTKLFESKAPYSVNSVKNSRSKSKRSGLSLVKNQPQNPKSPITIKPQRPATSFIPNPTSILKLGQQHNAKIMPPRASSSAKKVNFITLQQKQTIPSMSQYSPVLQISNHNHNRGISITRKQESKQKEVVIRPFNPPQQLGRTNNHFNTQLSSTISVGTLPSPKYQSRKQTAVMFNNKPINFATMSPSKSFQPNQSLTRFQTENVVRTNTPKVNAFVSSFYEVPTIYVHSPKMHEKILRVDSMSTQQQSRQKQLKHQPMVTQFPDDVKQTLSQNQSQVFYYPSGQQKRVTFQLPIQEKQQPRPIRQVHNYQIQGTSQLFTQPALYEYITSTTNINTNTNNNIHHKHNTQSFPRQQQQSKRASSKHFSYIDYLASAHIAQSMDSSTVPAADRLGDIGGSNKHIKQAIRKEQTISERRFTLNEFPTIQQLEQPQHSYQTNNQRQAGINKHNVPAPIRLKSNTNLSSRNQLPSVRRGYEESQVFQYNKFDDDTHRSEITPRRCQPSQFKKHAHIQSHVQANRIKQYSTAETWQPMAPIPTKSEVNSNAKPIYNVHDYRHPPIDITQKLNQQQPRRSSLSPLSKIIYNGTKQPAINPLLLQDMQKIRQNQVC